MAYVENSDNQMKFVLTSRGKELMFEHGLLNILKYFSVSDGGVIYTMDVEPNKLKDINGSHTNSTNVSTGYPFSIDE